MESKAFQGEGKYLTIECPWCDWANPSARCDRIPADGRVRLYIPRWSKLDSCQSQKSILLVNESRYRKPVNALVGALE